MKKYRVLYKAEIYLSRTVEATDEEEAIEIGFETLPGDGSLLSTRHEYPDVSDWEETLPVEELPL